MTTLDLYKFITSKQIEYHSDEDDIIIFVNLYDLQEWNDLLGTRILDEDGIECVLKFGYVCFELKHICEYFDIELTEVFEHNK